jgi:hypothetical protein
MTPKQQAEVLLINRIKNIESKGFLSHDDCRLLFGDYFQVSEVRDELSKYQSIQFYRNWLEHSEINRNIRQIFSELERQFSIPESEESTCHKIGELLSIVQLRNEFIRIMGLLGLTDFKIWHSYSLWKSFLGQLFLQLKAKPLKPKKPALIAQLLIEESAFGEILWKAEIITSKVDVKVNVIGPIPMPDIRKDFLYP